MDWPSRRISLFRIFAVATAFGIFSGLQAYNYVTLFTDRKQPFHILLALNITYWYAWAVLVPGMLWMARRYRFGRHTWKRAAAMHVGGVDRLHARARRARGDAAALLIMKALAGRDVSWWMYFQELFFLNFDWEMMTYWAVVGLSHALDFHRESQERELTAAQLRTRLAEANLQALQRQLHPHFLFNTLQHDLGADASRHRGRRRDARAAQRSAAPDARSRRHAAGARSRTSSTSCASISRSRRRASASACRCTSTSIPTRSTPRCRTSCCSRSSRTRCATASGRRSAAAAWTSARAARATTCWLEVRDNGVGLDDSDAFHKGVGLTNTRSRLEHLYGDRHRFECHTPPGGGLLVTVVIPFTLRATGQSLALGPDGSDMESVA